MPLLVGDANIFIDFEVGGLLDRLFELEDEIAVPDMLFEDELREEHADLIERGLLVLELGVVGMRRVLALAAHYRHPSRMDLAALALAEQEGCPLLTGDRHLREAAAREGLTVHGTLLLGERMVVAEIISVDELESAYGAMREGRRRLPWRLIEEQLERLRHQ